MMKSKPTTMALVIAGLIMCWALPAWAGDDEESRAAPTPGTVVMAGGGPYYSVPCGCIDRGVWSLQWLGRLHFGDLGALEAGVYNGTMVLGGNFPARGWSAGAQVAMLRQSDDRWWDGLSAKAGYRRWQVSGMRARGANGIYGGVNWSVEVMSHVHLEADAVVHRVFRTMSHFSLNGSVGLGLRL